MGNLILSRSFTLGHDEDEDKDREQEVEDHGLGYDDCPDRHNTDLGSAMEVDAPAPATNEHTKREESEDSEDEDDDDEETNTLEVVMVPLADMLNARYQCENVHDFSIYSLRPTFDCDLIGQTIL